MMGARLTRGAISPAAQQCVVPIHAHHLRLIFLVDNILTALISSPYFDGVRDFSHVPHFMHYA